MHSRHASRDVAVRRGDVLGLPNVLQLSYPRLIVTLTPRVERCAASMGTAPELEAAVANLALLVSIDPLIVYVLQMLREFLLEDVDDSQRSHGFLLLDLLGVVEYALLCLQFRVEVAEVQLPQLVLGLAVLVIVAVL